LIPPNFVYSDESDCTDFKDFDPFEGSLWYDLAAKTGFGQSLIQD